MAAVVGVSEFRAVWLAETCSNGGDQLTRVALAILVYDRTNSALAAAAVFALTYLAALGGGLGLSQLADRLPRRGLIIGCALSQAALVGLMAIPGMPLWVLFVLLTVVYLIQAPALSAQNALTRELFDDDAMYLRSQDLRGITTNTVTLVGLAGAGLIVLTIGTSWALLIDALTFVAAAALVAFGVRKRSVAADGNDGWFGAVRWVFGDHRLRVLLTLAWLVGLVVLPEGLAAPLAQELGAGSAAVGWLLAADPLGFVVGTFLLSHFVAAKARVAMIGTLATGSVGTLILFFVQPNLPVALALLVLAGAFGAYQIAVSATFNTLVPNAMLGGAIGVARTGLRVAQGVGIALGGAIAQLIGSAANTIALAGVLGVMIAVPATISWWRITRRGIAEPGTPAPDRQTDSPPNQPKIESQVEPRSA